MLPYGLDEPFGRLIASGCDQRLVPGADGLNPYGASVLPRRAVALGSCSCSSPSPRVTRAARHALDKLRRSSNRELTISKLQDSVRESLRKTLHLSPEVEIALTPSGTDLEMLSVAIASRGDDRQIVNIVVGPGEVGSGTCNAAAVCHYNTHLPRGGDAVIGGPVNEALAEKVTVEKIDIRDAGGKLLAPIEVDAAVTEAVVAAVSRDARAIVHLVAHSKTGVHAPTLGLMDRLTGTMKDDVVGIVDAAQGRLAPRAYAAALNRGLMVSFTGSKFFGGPPFAGALFVPPALSPVDTGLKSLPAGLEDYFCRRDLPESWFPVRAADDDWLNTGSLLRWVACASEIESYFAIDRRVRELIAGNFARAITESFRNLPNVSLLEPFVSGGEDVALPAIVKTPTVFSIELTDSAGTPLGQDALKVLHHQLNVGAAGTRFHLGQPVMIGTDRYVLRIALGGPLVIDIATDQSKGAHLRDRLESMKRMIGQLGAQIQALTESADVLQQS